MIDWSKSHCGVIACTPIEAVSHMPELRKLLTDAWRFGVLAYPLGDYLVDVKVHMLMPGQYPCIPGWHCDFVPRDADGKLLPDQVQPEHEMYLWLSGPPLTEFRDQNGVIRPVTPETWVPFTQTDEHRGVKATDFGWRCFIRLVPKELVPARVKAIAGLRRHSQVYIEDPEWFTW